MSEYRAIVDLKVKSHGVEQIIPAGTVITLSEAQAAHLVEAGKVVPIRSSETDVSTPASAPMPCLDSGGDLLIPVDSDSRYHWWNGGQSISVTLRELYEERAAIREFEGGQTRAEAEKGAEEDIYKNQDREK